MGKHRGLKRLKQVNRPVHMQALYRLAIICKRKGVGEAGRQSRLTCLFAKCCDALYTLEVTVTAFLGDKRICWATCPKLLPNKRAFNRRLSNPFRYRCSPDFSAWPSAVPRENKGPPSRTVTVECSIFVMTGCRSSP